MRFDVESIRVSISKSVTIEYLLVIIERQAALIVRLESRIVELEEEVARLRKGPSSGGGDNVPSFVRSNVPIVPKKERKPRSESCGRQREDATRIVEHSLDNCPDCARPLIGGWLHRVRQVIEIPETRYEVIEHRIMRRHCGVCGKNYEPKPDLSKEVVGKHRVGIRIMSLVVTLNKAYRMTVRSIKQILHSLFGLQLSIG